MPNPFAFTFTFVPTDPVVGLTEMEGMIVNLDVEVWAAVSVALIISVPTGLDGTVNVVLNEPVLSVTLAAILVGPKYMFTD